MSKQAFKAKLDAVESLRSHPDREQLRKALRDRNNYLVARAADIASDLNSDELIPDLLAAFDRFFVDGAKSDPRCLAQCRDSDAIRVLREFWQEPLLSTDLRQALIVNLGASPLREGADLLLEIVADAPVALATSAVAALATSRFHADVRVRLQELIAARDSSQLQAAFNEKFAP